MPAPDQTVASPVRALIEQLHTKLDELHARVAVNDECMQALGALYPISRALFAELEGVDTRSVNKFKWDQIIQSHLKLEIELAALKRGDFICSKCGLRKDGERDDPEF